MYVNREEFKERFFFARLSCDKFEPHFFFQEGIFYGTGI
jgi:hypothetical protein